MYISKSRITLYRLVIFIFESLIGRCGRLRKYFIIFIVKDIVYTLIIYFKISIKSENCQSLKTSSNGTYFFILEKKFLRFFTFKTCTG